MHISRICIASRKSPQCSLVFHSRANPNTHNPSRSQFIKETSPSRQSTLSRNKKSMQRARKEANPEKPRGARARAKCPDGSCRGLVILASAAACRRAALPCFFFLKCWCAPVNALFWRIINSGFLSNWQFLFYFIYWILFFYLIALRFVWYGLDYTE